MARGYVHTVAERGRWVPLSLALLFPLACAPTVGVGAAVRENGSPDSKSDSNASALEFFKM